VGEGIEEKTRDHRPVGLPPVFASNCIGTPRFCLRNGVDGRDATEPIGHWIPPVFRAMCCRSSRCITSACRGQVQIRSYAGDDHSGLRPFWQTRVARWTGAGTTPAGSRWCAPRRQGRALLDRASASSQVAIARWINVSGSRSRSLVRRMDGGD
jgi:hypothetical protein